MSLPNALIRLIGYGGEAFDFLNPRSTSARVCLETSVQAKRVQFFSNAKARKELGWTPADSIMGSVAEAVAWFRQEAEIELAPAVTSSLESNVQ
jgi:nucleoside-diphosphate-sugar epimerase